MPQTITTTVYTLAELKASGNKKGHDRAMAWMRETESELWDGNDILETWRPALEAIGFHEPRILYSGFYSQGDGAGFACKHICLPDVLKFMAGETPAEYDWPDLREARPAYNPAWRRLAAVDPWLSASIEHTGRHCHERSFEINWDLHRYKEYPRLDTMLSSFMATDGPLDELRVSLCDAIYADLKGDYEARLEDEALEDTAEANEYTFTADGERFG